MRHARLPPRAVEQSTGAQPPALHAGLRGQGGDGTRLLDQLLRPQIIELAQPIEVGDVLQPFAKSLEPLGRHVTPLETFPENAVIIAIARIEAVDSV